MDFDLKRISQYLEFVLPRLNKDQLQAHRVGAAFRDSGCIVWPRNTHLLVLTVPDLKNGMRIWENVQVNFKMAFKTARPCTIWRSLR